MATLRTFIAVPLPETVSGHLREVAASMAGAWDAGAVRWVHPGSMHLTLRFLGDTDPDVIPALSAALQAGVSRMNAFQVTLAEACCIPGERRPRVIWVALADPRGQLAALHRTVEHLVRTQGFPRERRSFKPHLTLGRVRQRAVVPARRWLQDPEPMPVPVREVHLIESRLKPSGAEYLTLARGTLAGADTPASRERDQHTDSEHTDSEHTDSG